MLQALKNSVIRGLFFFLIVGLPVDFTPYFRLMEAIGGMHSSRAPQQLTGVGVYKGGETLDVQNRSCVSVH